MNEETRGKIIGQTAANLDPYWAVSGSYTEKSPDEDGARCNQTKLITNEKKKGKIRRKKSQTMAGIQCNNKPFSKQEEN